MLSKIFLLVFCLMVLNCSMVSAKPKKCFHKELTRDGQNVTDFGEVECTNDEDICYFYVKFYNKQVDLYGQRCGQQSLIPSLNSTNAKLSTLNGDQTRVCAVSEKIVNTKKHTKFYCKCDDDLCNSNKSPLYNELLKIVKEKTNVKLSDQIIFNDRPAPDSADSKQIMIILAFVMMIHSFIFV